MKLSRKTVKRWLTSLQSRYMLLIFIALILFQFVYLLAAIVFTGLTKQQQPTEQPEYTKVEAEWHEAAKALGSNHAEAVQQLYQIWGQRFPEAAMFWVNGDGKLQSSWNVERELPHNWSAPYTAKYMKLSYGNDPYTVIAFVAGEEQHGFVVIEMPRHLFQLPLNKVYDEFGNLLFISVILIVLLFIVISYWFFRSIRRRLLHLQRAMSIRDLDSLPVAIEVRKQDEIGQLEQAFNHMVLELKHSKAREQEDERLRRQLIANLSHDIRTPLTKLRANAYTIRKHELPDEVGTAADALESSVRQIDELVDNLLAYTLLIGERYRMELQEIAMPRFLREHVAAWYAAFEQEGFVIEMKLGAMSEHNWLIDPLWMKRVLDNLLQNVLRHAYEGKYVAIETARCDGYDVIRVIDRGRGIENEQETTYKQEETYKQAPNDTITVSTGNRAGSGIGLSIVDMMIKGMNLSWHMYRHESCFIVEIRKPHLNLNKI